MKEEEDPGPEELPDASPPGAEAPGAPGSGAAVLHGIRRRRADPVPMKEDIGEAGEEAPLPEKVL